MYFAYVIHCYYKNNDDVKSFYYHTYKEAKNKFDILIKNGSKSLFDECDCIEFVYQDKILEKIINRG